MDKKTFSIIRPKVLSFKTNVNNIYFIIIIRVLNPNLLDPQPNWCGGSVVVDFLFIVTPIVGVCNCSMFCCTLLYVHSGIAIILIGKRELIALLNLSSCCLVMAERLFLAVPWGCL